jgi:hypothetical protein
MRSGLPHLGRWIARLAAAMGVLALIASSPLRPAIAQFVTADEDSLKVAFLYNFMNFTEWPTAAFPGPQEPFSLCISAPASLNRAVDGLASKTLNGRPIVIRHIGAADQAWRCQILYVEESDVKTARRILETFGGQAVLTVSGYAQQGSIITLVRSNNRFAFEINVEAATRAGLRFSSKLLNLAKIVGE